MGKLNMKGSTPVGSESMCRTCSYAQIMRGFRESELLTMCDNVHPNIVVPFAIYECTGYYDKNRPSWDEMKKLAIDVVPGTLKPVGFKTGTDSGVGFVHTTTIRVGGEPDEDEDE